MQENIKTNTNQLDIYSLILEANDRIASLIVRTPIDKCQVLSKMFDAQVFLKCEHLQHTGSFKLRGALNKLVSLQQNTNKTKLNVIAASTGNHGLAVAYAAKQLNAHATIYLPKSTPATKQAAIKDLGATIVSIDGVCLHAEIEARSQSEAKGHSYISPYNDIGVIAGQGTIGCEINQKINDIDAVFISVGGGGLISGIATYLKAINPKIRIVGCWPENAQAMLECLRAEQIIDVIEKSTLSTSTAGGVEPNSITFSLCQKLIDDYVWVTEQEIIQGIRLIAEHERWLVEGAAGVAVAAFIKKGAVYRGKKVAILLCGRNISLEQIGKVFS